MIDELMVILRCVFYFIVVFFLTQIIGLLKIIVELLQ